MSTAPVPQDQPKPDCCGEGPTGGAHKAGEGKQTVACQLCPQSGRYWRKPKA